MLVIAPRLSGPTKALILLRQHWQLPLALIFSRGPKSKVDRIDLCPLWKTCCAPGDTWGAGVHMKVSAKRTGPKYNKKFPCSSNVQSLPSSSIGSVL